MSGRVPPHNLQAEESLIGAMLLSVPAAEIGLASCVPEDFYKPAHGFIFDAIRLLRERAEPADPVTVADELRRMDLLEAIGGPATLITLQSNTPATTNAGKYATIITEHSLLRRLIGVSGEVAERGYGGEDAAGLLDYARGALFDLDGQTATGAKDAHALSGDFLDALEYRYEHGEALHGLATGFIDLDLLLGGIEASSLVIIGARPSMGKSAMATNIALYVALTLRLPVVLFSLEMSAVEVMNRVYASQGRVDMGRLRSGKLLESDWPRISHALSSIGECPLMVDDSPNRSVMEMLAECRRVKARHGGLGLVIVDYLQLMSGRAKAENRQVQVSEISRGLKLMARELETPVIALSQLHRGLEMRGDKRPVLSDLRDSGSLEQDSDAVFFIYRDEVYNPDSQDRGIAEIIVAKHRNGPTGVVRLAWLAAYTKFANMARGL